MLVNNENINSVTSMIASKSPVITTDKVVDKSAPAQESVVSTNMVSAAKPTNDIRALNELAKSNSTVKDLEKASKRVDELFMQYTNRELNFEEDKDTGKMVIRILDRDSGEVVRQIPPQQFLDMMAAFAKFAEGMTKDLPKFV